MSKRKRYKKYGLAEYETVEDILDAIYVDAETALDRHEIDPEEIRSLREQFIAAGGNSKDFPKGKPYERNSR